ncbi:MAG: hypothetical protein U0932_14470 [Thiobacillus sp.]|nr:hypothetical protein [Thiobacillus sp.]
MKLQVNNTGAWRDVIRFDAGDEAFIRQQAYNLLRLSDGKASMRIADDQNTATARCKGPEFEWVNAR